MDSFKERRAAQLAHFERLGAIRPECEMCQETFYADTERMPADVFAPRHNSRCGRRSHCTCDSCF